MVVLPASPLVTKEGRNTQKKTNETHPAARVGDGDRIDDRIDDRAGEVLPMPKVAIDGSGDMVDGIARSPPLPAAPRAPRLLNEDPLPMPPKEPPPRLAPSRMAANRF